MPNVPPPPIAAITFGKKNPISTLPKRSAVSSADPPTARICAGRLSDAYVHTSAPYPKLNPMRKSTSPTTLSSFEGPAAYARSSSAFATAIVVMPDSSVGRRPQRSTSSDAVTTARKPGIATSAVASRACVGDANPTLCKIVGL